MCNFAYFSTCWHERSQAKLFFSRLVHFSPSSFSDTLGNNTIFIRFDLLSIESGYFSWLFLLLFRFITLFAFLSCIKKCPNKNRPMSCEFLFTFFFLHSLPLSLQVGLLSNTSQAVGRWTTDLQSKKKKICQHDQHLREPNPRTLASHESDAQLTDADEFFLHSSRAVGSICSICYTLAVCLIRGGLRFSAEILTRMSSWLNYPTGSASIGGETNGTDLMKR